MIDHAMALLQTTRLPSWTDDAPLRRELESLREDVRSYQIAAGYDTDRAALKADLVNERADRIRDFLKGHRHGTQQRRSWEQARTPA